MAARTKTTKKNEKRRRFSFFSSLTPEKKTFLQIRIPGIQVYIPQMLYGDHMAVALFRIFVVKLVSVIHKIPRFSLSLPGLYHSNARATRGKLYGRFR